jgi:hypothetical protein
MKDASWPYFLGILPLFVIFAGPGVLPTWPELDKYNVLARFIYLVIVKEDVDILRTLQHTGIPPWLTDINAPEPVMDSHRLYHVGIAREEIFVQPPHHIKADKVSARRVKVAQTAALLDRLSFDIPKCKNHCIGRRDEGRLPFGRSRALSPDRKDDQGA